MKRQRKKNEDYERQKKKKNVISPWQSDGFMQIISPVGLFALR